LKHLGRFHRRPARHRRLRTGALDLLETHLAGRVNQADHRGASIAYI